MADFLAIPMEPTSITANSIAALLRPKTVCAYPGNNKELRKARRGLSGGLGVSMLCFGCATPARALSRCCALATEGGPSAIASARRNGMAGECGNRTHPALRRRVTVILKITEATRPHPPPFQSDDFDRNVSPKNDLPHDYRALDA